MAKILHLTPKQRQVSAEPMRFISADHGVITLTSEWPDGTRTTEIFTPSQAREFAEDLIEAARDAEADR